MKHILITGIQKIIAAIARALVRKYSPQIIAITGSVGKTSAKEAIYAALKDTKNVRKTSANFNNELGVPLTIIGSWQHIWHPVPLFWVWVIFSGIASLLFGSKKKYPQILILEYGADKPGDIEKLVAIAKPYIGVISGIGNLPVHVENYPGGVASLVKQKGVLVHSLLKSDWAVVNADDQQTLSLLEKTKAQSMTYGFGAHATVRASHVGFVVNAKKHIDGVSFKVEQKGSSVPVVVEGAFSISHAYAALCAICVADILWVNSVQAGQAISHNYRPQKGRSLLLEGIKNTQIIDESYNSSPLALEVALEAMARVDFRRKVAILGDMLELGELTLRAHEKIGDLVPQSVDILITVGLRAKHIAQQALKRGMVKDVVFKYEEAQDAAKKAQEILKEGDLVLIKGSRILHLDEIVEELVARD